MSFLQKAREAAEQMAAQAREAVEPPAAFGVSESGEAVVTPAAIVQGGVDDPVFGVADAWSEGHAGGLPDADAVKAQLAGAFGVAKKGIAGVIDKIDAGTMADIIIKATALQEKTNKALRGKGSLYRISEISISASLPPAVSFAISRNDDPDEATTVELSSTEILAETGA